MSIRRWIWELNTVGATAVANLAVFGLCGLLHLCLLRDGVIHVDLEPAWRIAVARTLEFSMLSLAFPVGWISILVCSIEPPWAAVVFVPLNAYGWGSIGEMVWRRRIEIARWRRVSTLPTLHRCSNPDCSVHYAFDLNQCPACGTPTPVQVTQTPMSVDRPSLLYIVVAGVVIPMIFGSIVAAVFAFWNQFVAIAAVVAGACFILAVVRLLNRRHDPRHVRQPAEPSDSIRDIHQT